MRLLPLFASFFIFTIGSAQNIVTDRPDQTEASSTIPMGALQVESGFLLGFTGDSPKLRQIIAPTTLFRYGITENIEFRLVNEYQTFRLNDENFSGIGDLQLGAKIQLLDEPDKNTEIAFMSHLIAPTGTPVVSNGLLGVINRILVSHSLTDDLGIAYNLAYNNFGEGNGDLAYSFSLGQGVSDKWGLYVETFGDFKEMDELKASSDAGVTYLLADATQLDFSFGTGLNHPMNYISIGISWLARKAD